MKNKIIGSALVAASAFAAIFIIALILLLLTLLYVGGKDTLTFEFLFSAPREGMTAGGIFPAIVGTALLVMIMAIAGVQMTSVQFTTEPETGPE